MRTSTTAMSGLCTPTLRSKSSASPAWPTTSKPDSSSSRAIPSRSSTESSAITTRMRSSGAARISHRHDDRAVRAPVSEGPDGLGDPAHGKRPADDGCDHQLPDALIDPGRADSDEQLVVTDHRRFDLPEPQDVRLA